MGHNEEKIHAIVAEQFNEPASEIKPETSLLNDMNMDSLDLVELVMEIEDEFDVAIEDHEAENWTTVSDIVKHVNGQLQ